MRILKTFIVFIFVIMFAISCNISRKLLYYPQGISKSRLEYIRNNYKNVTELKIKTEDDIYLHGWFIQKDLNKLPTIIYFGGNAEEVSLNIEDFNSKLDANFILLNYRGYGLSTGSPTEEKLKLDSQKIYLQAIEQYSLNPDKIFVMGRSLGTGIATYLAVKKEMPKLILITPYESIKEVAYDYFHYFHYFPKFLVNLILSDKYESIELCDKLQSNVLMLVADHDEVIHPSHAETLYNKIQSSKKLVYIRNSGHNDIIQSSKYWEKIRKHIK